MASKWNLPVDDALFSPDELKSASWNLTEVDHMLLIQSDDEYEPHTWHDLQEIIGTLLASLGNIATAR